jgi:signal transduction histidine kinase
MKVRTVASFITATMILVPTVFICGWLMVSRYSEIQKDAELLKAISEAEQVAKTGRWSLFSGAKHLQTAYRSLIAIANEDDLIVYSSIPAIRVGDSFPAIIERVSPRIDSDENGITIYTHTIHDAGQIKRWVILVQLDASAARPFWDSLTGFAPLAIIAIVLLLLVGFSLVMLRSVAGAILALELQTRALNIDNLQAKIEVTGCAEVEELSRTFDSLRRRIAQHNRERNQVIIGLSHDFKTPLAIIRGNAEYLRKTLPELEGDEKERLQSIEFKVDHLEGMVEDLAEFIDIGTQQVPSEEESTDIEPWLLEYCKKRSVDAEVLGRCFSYSVDIAAGSKVRMNHRLSERAFDNLIYNAFRYTEESGRVFFIAKQFHDQIEITIRDNGVGISSTEIDQVFDWFYRGTPSRQTQGMGIGLAVVKSVCELHGWEVEAKSKPGVVTDFIIRMHCTLSNPKAVRHG